MDRIVENMDEIEMRRSKYMKFKKKDLIDTIFALQKACGEALDDLTNANILNHELRANYDSLKEAYAELEIKVLEFKEAA